jgi:protein O-GlcNAc transferase
MLDLDQEAIKKFQILFNNKQYSTLEFEINFLGDIKDQHPKVIMLYALSKTLNPMSKEDDLLEANHLYEEIYSVGKKKVPRDPDYLDPIINMIFICFKTKTYDCVLPFVLEAFEDNPKNERIIEGLALIYAKLFNFSDAVKYYQLLFKINPTRTAGRMVFLAGLNYVPDITQEYYLSECLKHSEILEKDLIDEVIPTTNKNEIIKVAFLSSDFKIHSVSFFLEDLFLKFDKEKIEVFAISTLDEAKQDIMTETIKNLTDHWYNVSDKSETEIVGLIRSLNIDILIDLNGFTGGNKINVIKNRCAPIQISWLGYNNSTGIKNIDYLIADKNLIKKNEENLYSEKILFLPKIWNALAKPKDLPQINLLSKMSSTPFSYGSFNNFSKISEDVIDIWSKILRSTNSQIYLKNPRNNTPSLTKKNIIEKFLSRNVPKNKILFLDHQQNRHDHLELYNKIDLALDTFPFPGVTTSCEAVLMAVPVLTMKGYNFNSRCGESININLKMENFIAENKNDYVNKAISWQHNFKTLEKIKKNLREKALSSPVFDTESFAKNFTNILREVYLEKF